MTFETGHLESKFATLKEGLYHRRGFIADAGLRGRRRAHREVLGTPRRNEPRAPPA